jgi:hypothetical protein|tara:strand:+ start:11910 stop:12305 length:396 start_codon:yes stop_codon:yes gene_type:complete
MDVIILNKFDEILSEYKAYKPWRGYVFTLLSAIFVAYAIYMAGLYNFTWIGAVWLGFFVAALLSLHIPQTLKIASTFPALVAGEVVIVMLNGASGQMQHFASIVVGVISFGLAAKFYMETAKSLKAHQPDL